MGRSVGSLIPMLLLKNFVFIIIRAFRDGQRLPLYLSAETATVGIEPDCWTNTSAQLMHQDACLSLVKMYPQYFNCVTFLFA